MYTQSRLTFCLIHHTLLAPSPASSAIPASDHVPPDISRMPCASSTRRSHSQSSTDIGPLPLLFLVHHLACTMPWTVSGLHHALDRIRLAPCPGPYPACTMPWTISGLHHALDHIRLAPCPGPYPACTMPWTISGLHHALDRIRSTDVSSARIPSTLGIQLRIGVLSNPANTAGPVLQRSGEAELPPASQHCMCFQDSCVLRTASLYLGYATHGFL
jgi:hypothetical protein